MWRPVHGRELGVPVRGRELRERRCGAGWDCVRLSGKMELFVKNETYFVWGSHGVLDKKREKGG